jgi:exosortase/archaeosortase family protein
MDADLGCFLYIFRPDIPSEVDVQRILNRYVALVFIQLAAIWPVLNWYMLRMLDKSDEPYGLLALITVIIFLLSNKSHSKPKLFYLYIPALILLAYSLIYHSCFYDLDPLKSILVVLCAIIAIMISNILRATSLFYMEAGILDLPSWSHTMLGIIIFALTSAAIVWITLRIGKEPCAR